MDKMKKMNRRTKEVIERTAKMDLQDLVKKNVVKRVGKGAGTRYVAV